MPVQYAACDLNQEHVTESERRSSCHPKTGSASTRAIFLKAVNFKQWKYERDKLIAMSVKQHHTPSVFFFFTNCCIHRTYLHTVVTDTAMWTARWTVEVTGSAPLHPYLYSFDFHIFVEGSSKVIILIFILISLGKKWIFISKIIWSQKFTILQYRRGEKKKHGLVRCLKGL